MSACLNFFNGALQPSELISNSSSRHKPFLFLSWFLQACFLPHVLMYLMFTHWKLLAVLQNDLAYLPSLDVIFPGSFHLGSTHFFFPIPSLAFAPFSFFPQCELSRLLWATITPIYTSIIILSIWTCNWFNCL